MSTIWSRLINLAGNITGTLPVANGGTGLTSGTSGGVLAYTASGTLASSGALTQHAVVVGGGAGAAPLTIAAGTNGQLLVGVTSADPAFGSTVSAATTFSGGVVFNGGGTNLNNYFETTVSIVFNTGAFTGGSAQTVVAVVRQVGKTVTIQIPAVSATTNATSASMSTSGTPLSSYVPAATFAHPIVALNNNAQQAGILFVNTSGTVEVDFFTNSSSTITSGTATTGFRSIVASWPI